MPNEEEKSNRSTPNPIITFRFFQVACNSNMSSYGVSLGKKAEQQKELVGGTTLATGTIEATWNLQYCHLNCCHRISLIGWFINNRLVLITLKVGESRIKVSAGVVSGEDPLPALWVTVFLLYPQWMKREENSLGSA